MRSMFRAASVALASLVLSGAAQAQQAFKIGYVNTQALMEAAPGMADVRATLEKESEGYRAQLKKMSDSLNAEIAKFQKEEPTLGATAKAARQKRLQGMETEMQAKQLQLEQAFSQRQNELFAPVSEAVKKVIEDIRAEDGYSVIFQNDPGQSPIVAADKNLDITDRVVSRLRTVAAAKPAAATKPGASSNPAGVTRPPIKPPAQ
jgi:outer membrane protein